MVQLSASSSKPVVPGHSSIDFSHMSFGHMLSSFLFFWVLNFGRCRNEFCSVTSPFDFFGGPPTPPNFDLDTPALLVNDAYTEYATVQRSSHALERIRGQSWGVDMKEKDIRMMHDDVTVVGSVASVK